MKKRKNKINDENLKKLALFTLVIIVLFMSIISIELIVVIYTGKIYKDSLKHREITTTTKRAFTDETVKFRNVDVTVDRTDLSKLCKKGCNLSTKEIGKEYRYQIKLVDGNYLLNVIDGKDYLLYLKNLGKSVENLYFTNYLNYVVLGTIVENNYFEYDYAVVLDNQGGLDEFESLDKDEMVFGTDGIIYYYDQCVNNGNYNAEKVQAIRYPFNTKPKVLGKEIKHYNWCD